MASQTDLFNKVIKLMEFHEKGELGGEMMPEDSNPKLSKDSQENYLYFTLPMALNYQRNSFKLWESALLTYHDPDTNFIFEPSKVISVDFLEVQKALTKYGVAL